MWKPLVVVQVTKETPALKNDGLVFGQRSSRKLVFQDGKATCDRRAEEVLVKQNVAQHV